ncbi:MAG TPA: hypothetical protein VFB21_00915 [Chthonomonadaceae bacterium]|nr:hypothetical protein [Chthonomonadaceae bacterium]
MRARKRASRVARLRATAAASLLALALWMLPLPGVWAQSAPALPTTPRLTETTLDGGTFDSKLMSRGILGVATAASVPGGVPGTSFSEVLRGNGTRAGYVLSHGGVLPDTVSIRLGARRLRAGTDYWLDPNNGTLMLAEPVRTFESLDVYYRYVEGQDGQRQAGGLPGFQLKFGPATNLGFFYGMTPGNGNGFDTSTYGLSFNSKFGAGGLSSYSGLMYFSNVQRSTNLVTTTRASLDAPPPPAPNEQGADHLIVQNLAAQTGGFNFRANYQDIGKNFAGFQALRLNAAKDTAFLDQLKLLEGEKGVRRLGFGFGYSPNAKSATPQGLQLDWNQISDEKGSISQQSLGFTSSSLTLNYASRSISDQFIHFKGLREADRAQWEREKGMTFSSFGLGLDFGMRKPGVSRGGLNFQEQRFGDTSGSLERSLWSLKSGSFGFAMLNRSADKDFKRLNDLSAADKTSLALDLYRQYDPAAKPEQVTDKDRAQVAQEAGLARNALRLDLGFGKTGGLAFSQIGVLDQKEEGRAGFRRDSLTFRAGSLELAYLSRKTDAGFQRIGDLADVEKNNLALDIRRQFDPDATLDQVTQKERDQAVKETGLARTGLRGRIRLGKEGRNGTLAFNQFSIANLQADPENAQRQTTLGAIRRSTLDFAGARFKFLFASQSISEQFARLTDLSDVERAQFGNEHGLQRQQMGLDFALNKATRLTFNSLAIRNTPDAVASALAAAQKDGSDPQAAATAASYGLSRQSFLLDGQGFRLGFNTASTDKNFTRASDLALPDADKKSIEQERGFQRTDYTFNFDRIKGLRLENYFYSASNPTDSLGRDVYKQNLAFVPNQRMALSFVRDGDLTSADGKQNGTAHSLLTFNQNFGKGFLFNLYQDDTATYADGAATSAAKTDYMRFQSDQSKPNSFNIESKRIALLNDKYENTTNLNLHFKPTKTLGLNYSRLDIDRGDDPSESTDAFDFQWQTSKQFAVVAGVAQKDTTDSKNVNTVSVGLQGEPIKNVTLAAKFHEVHQEAVNTKDEADISISNAKPITFGPFQELTITARYASLNDQRKLQNETMTGRAAWKLWKNEFLLDYGGFTKPDGTSTITRVYQFTTDPNPNKWFHAGFLYKARTLLDGKEVLTRRFTADWRLSKNTTFLYSYGTMPEDSSGNVTPVTTADITFKHAFRRPLSFLFFYRMNNNDATKILTRGLGFGFEGKLSSTSKLELDYSKDTNGFADRYERCDHFRLLFDHQFNPDHFITFSAEFRTHDGNDLKDESAVNLDFRRRF